LVSKDRIQEVHRQLPDRTTIIKGIKQLGEKRGKPDAQELLQYLNDHQEDIFRIAEATLIAYRVGEEGWFIAFNDSDPIVRKAREMIHLDVMIALRQN
jgi:hypothetical protein